MSYEMKKFWYDIRYALLGMFIGGFLLNWLAINIYQGIFGFCTGTALVMTMRLIMNPFVMKHDQYAELRRILKQGILKDNER